MKSNRTVSFISSSLAQKAKHCVLWGESLVLAFSTASRAKTVLSNGEQMLEVTSIHGLRGYLEREEVEKLIAAATNPRDKAFLALLARTGICISEAIAVKTRDNKAKTRNANIY